MEYMAMKKLLASLVGHADAWPFMTPVDGSQVTDYYEVIEYPMGA